MPDPIEENLRRVRERIERACARAGRLPADVLLVAVTKAFPASVVNRALAAGLLDIGENRVQELREKADQVSGKVRWHLIGHLQSNKAKIAARLCDVIQTVDSISLAEKLSREAQEAEKRVQVLIQVNIGREAQKSGIDPDNIDRVARSVASLGGLSLTGLMTIPPMGDESQTRAYFQEMRTLRDRTGLHDLSMGMTDDFEIAIEEGATMIRVGRALFGERG